MIEKLVLRRSVSFVSLAGFCAVWSLVGSPLGGCGGSSNDAAPNDGGGASDARDTGSEAASEAGPDASQPGTVAMIVPYMTETGGRIGVFGLRSDGTIVDDDIRLEGIDGPKGVAIRADGREALVAYSGGGGQGAEKGIVVVALEPDGSAAHVEQTLPIGNRQAPRSIFYANDDEAVFTLFGPDPSTLQVMKRGASGWALGPSAPCGTGPLKLRALPDEGHAMLLRTDFGTGDSELLPVSRGTDGSWKPDGPGVPLSHNPIDFVVGPTSKTVYLPQSKEGTVGPNEPGQLTRIDQGTGGAWATGAAVEMDHAGSLMAITMKTAGGANGIGGANGMGSDGVAVVAAPIWEIDPQTHNAYVARYHLVTLDVAADDTMTPRAGTPTETPAGVFEGLAIGPAGHLVTTVFLDDRTKAETPYPLTSYRPSASGGTWERVGDPLYLPGIASTVAIGPAR